MSSARIPVLIPEPRQVPAQEDPAFPWGRIFPELPSVTIRVSRGPRLVARKRRVVRTEGWRLRESAALVWRAFWN